MGNTTTTLAAGESRSITIYVGKLSFYESIVTDGIDPEKHLIQLIEYEGKTSVIKISESDGVNSVDSYYEGTAVPSDNENIVTYTLDSSEFLPANSYINYSFYPGELTGIVSVCDSSDNVLFYGTFVADIVSSSAEIISIDEKSMTSRTESLLVLHGYYDSATSYTPNFLLSPGATISPEGPRDFTDSEVNPLVYTVTAQDGTKRVYYISLYSVI